MKKLKNEKELLKKAIQFGMNYAEKRGVAQFEATDSHNAKIEYIYRLLVHDKLMQPLAGDQENLPNMQHKLAIWMARQLGEIS
ncbi:MAG: DUF5062 family protein [Gammaproteobacteria bacterium]|nr:DUF5062 family protein [Gammaproteobacteria bacterium]MCP4880327.1 DUF5062 family protein [Gammaproteobacteria bacterium]MDP6165611.1 DUF5062 family protein [Gammaproteobacteria bacterium]